MPALRVLVVEDNQDAADSLRLLVSLWGHDVRVAHDGPAAIAIARQFQPHAVLLDIGLPGMDGWQVGAALLELPATSTAFLLAVSGLGSSDDLEHSLEAGLHGYMLKPVDPAELEGLLGHLHLLYCSGKLPLPRAPKTSDNAPRDDVEAGN